jgi:hypothetical protein
MKTFEKPTLIAVHAFKIIAKALVLQRKRPGALYKE